MFCLLVYHAEPLGRKSCEAATSIPSCCVSKNVWGWVSLYDGCRFRLIESAGLAVKPMNDPFTSRLTLTLPGESCSYLSGPLREQERGMVM